MVSVKGVVRPAEVHAQMLMAEVLQRSRRDFDPEDWDGLRPSHFRLLTFVPPDGVSITELGELVGMTKQGCGQFVSQLTGTGHLVVEPDADDRRVRRVRRTELGDRLITEVVRTMHKLEDEWADEVGRRRYATFRAVLEELALDGG